MIVQNMIYAIKNEKLVHISEVDSGLKCNCRCPACGEELIAKKGIKMIHHFAHKSTIECEFGYQTSLHLAAKKIISENLEIKVPALYLEFPGVYKKEMIIGEKSVKVTNVILEKKLDNIIPDILIITDIGEIIVEIFVTHEIDEEKLEKIKCLDIPTIEINLSDFDRNITEEDLKEVLINGNQSKVWIYNGKRREVYDRFLEQAEYKKIINRNCTSHVDYCPVQKRIWKGKPYANFMDDCDECEFCISYTSILKEEGEDERSILCTGKNRIAHLEDFDIPIEKRRQDYEEKREEEKYELIGLGICPYCGSALKIKKGKYGEFFGCSNYPHCEFTFSYHER
jgi:Competence protein